MMLQKVPPKELYEVMEIGVHPALVNLRPHELKLIKDKSSLAKGVFQQLMATYEAEVGQYATVRTESISKFPNFDIWLDFAVSISMGKPC